MSDEVESIRKDIGEKMARDGEKLHAGASDSVKAGYRRGTLGFGSNLMPRKFAKGADESKDWACVCGSLNRRYLVQCGICGVNRRYGDSILLKERVEDD